MVSAAILQRAGMPAIVQGFGATHGLSILGVNGPEKDLLGRWKNEGPIQKRQVLWRKGGQAPAKVCGGRPDTLHEREVAGPGKGSPCATGGECHRDRREAGGEVTGSNRVEQAPLIVLEPVPETEPEEQKVDSDSSEGAGARIDSMLAGREDGKYRWSRKGCPPRRGTSSPDTKFLSECMGSLHAGFLLIFPRLPHFNQNPHFFSRVFPRYVSEPPGDQRKRGERGEEEEEEGGGEERTDACYSHVSACARYSLGMCALQSCLRLVAANSYSQGKLLLLCRL